MEKLVEEDESRVLLLGTRGKARNQSYQEREGKNPFKGKQTELPWCYHVISISPDAGGESRDRPLDPPLLESAAGIGTGDQSTRFPLAGSIVIGQPS